MTTFRINRVYTRSGDAGDTGLVGGDRVRKNSLRVASYGDIDELNSVIGIGKEFITEQTQELFALLERIQQELFDLGAELATPTGGAYPGMWRASDADVTRLEELCDQYGEHLPELASFILPGGSRLVAHLHLARTVCRRAERTIISLMDEERTADPAASFNLTIIRYVNRLSDLLFVLCRWSLDREGKQAPIWLPAKDRNQ